MTTKTFNKELERESIMDNISNRENENQASSDEKSNDAKLAELRAKLAVKMRENQKERELQIQREKEEQAQREEQIQKENQEKKETPVAPVVVKKEKSVNFGFIGSGQAGSRLVEIAYKLGYDAVAINTAQQDLKFIDIPESNKLLLENTFGGAAKELSIGQQAAEKYRDQINDLVNTQLADSQIIVLALSLGGGSGAGSCETMVDILSTTGKPVVVITVLPMDSEDAQCKSNALQTLSKLAKFAQTKKIANLIVVDNAKIEAMYKDISQVDFFAVANRAIIEPIDVFNTLSAMPSFSKPLDSMEFLKLFIDGEGLTTYGSIKVHNYKDEDAIALAIIENLNGNLLASGFDIAQSKYVGIIVAANAKVWKEIPSAHINYALAMVNDQCNNPTGVFKGLYVIDTPEDCVIIYSMFSGLSLPDSRVEQLRKESAQLQALNKDKSVQRNLSLRLDSGTENTVGKVQELKNKISQKSSAMGKLLSNNVIDRRK
jgi:cell division GTPase FtsZ